MESSTWLWIVIALVLLAVVVAAVMMGRRKKAEHDRTRAHELREQAAAQATGVQQHEARAKETAAQAEQARAEAQRKAAEAERLEAEARDREATAAEVREKHEDHLRRADELDPDVDHRATDREPAIPEQTSHDDSTVSAHDTTVTDDEGRHRA